MPNISDILDSVSIPQLIKDAEIQGGDFERDKFGNLVHYTGGFTVVFPVTVKGQKWAFRCWHIDTGIDALRMKVLSSSIEKKHLKYLCDFKYVDEGIVITGKIYPTSKMRWVSGKTINEYIIAHKNEKDVLLKLANDFLDMVRELHSNHIAHGDLQHGNIMVKSNGDLYLVDYDSMYCPEMGSVADTIKGKEDFQHPARKRHNERASEKLDYFSELIIYISILAIAESPSLLGKYNIDDSLLFKSDDYENLTHSQVYADIVHLDGIFPLLLDFLKGYLDKNDINELEPFDILLDRNRNSPEIVTFECQNGNKVIVGKESVLNFQITHAAHLAINGKEINPNDTQYVIKPDKVERKIYTIEASNWYEKKSKDLALDIMAAPSVDLKISKKKIRRGKNEQCVITWNVQNLQSPRLIEEAGNWSEDINSTGSKSIRTNKNTQYKIIGIMLDGVSKYESQAVTVFVFDESQTVFTADKKFSFASIPITLKWETKYAKKVSLDGHDVEKSGTFVLSHGIVKDRIFTLRVEDEFGVNEEKVLVKLLPLPIVKSLLVPTPSLSVKIDVKTTIPVPMSAIELTSKFSSFVHIPVVELSQNKIVPIKTPTVPQFTLPKSIRWWQFNRIYQYVKTQVRRNSMHQSSNS